MIRAEKQGRAVHIDLKGQPMDLIEELTAVTEAIVRNMKSHTKGGITHTDILQMITKHVYQTVMKNTTGSGGMRQ